MQFRVDYIGDWCVAVCMILNITEVQIIARAKKIYFINICISLIGGNDCIKVKARNLPDISHLLYVSTVDDLMLICLIYMLRPNFGMLSLCNFCYCT